MDAQRLANGTAGRLDEGPASIEVDIAGELLAGPDRQSHAGLRPLKIEVHVDKLMDSTCRAGLPVYICGFEDWVAEESFADGAAGRYCSAALVGFVSGMRTP